MLADTYAVQQMEPLAVVSDQGNELDNGKQTHIAWISAVNQWPSQTLLQSLADNIKNASVTSPSNIDLNGDATNEQSLGQSVQVKDKSVRDILHKTSTNDVFVELVPVNVNDLSPS